MSDNEKKNLQSVNHPPLKPHDRQLQIKLYPIKHSLEGGERNAEWSQNR